MKNTTQALTLAGMNGYYEKDILNITPQDFTGLIDDYARRQFRINLNNDGTQTLINILKNLDLIDKPNEPKLHKRVFKMWKQYKEAGTVDYDLADNVGKIISDIQEQYCKPSKIKLYWRTTADIQGLCRPGTSNGYGNPSSCWYTSYKPSAPYTLEQHGGIALLISDQQEINQQTGTGRIFIFNGYQNYLTMFNPYIQHGIYDNPAYDIRYRIFADLIATELLKLTPEKNGYKDETTDEIYRTEYSQLWQSDTIYINQDSGQVFMNIENPEGYSHYHFEDCFNEDLDNGSWCENCGSHVSEDDIYISPNGDYLCSDCFFERYTYCDHCSEVIRLDDAYLDNEGTPYCEYCYSERYTHCDNCDCEIRHDQAFQADTEGDYDTYCENCYSAKYTVCCHCNKEILREEAMQFYNVENTDYCPECHALITQANEERARQRQAERINA